MMKLFRQDGSAIELSDEDGAKAAILEDDDSVADFLYRYELLGCSSVDGHIYSIQ